MDAIEPSNYEQAGWSDLTYEYVQALRTALDAATARAERLVDELARALNEASEAEERAEAALKTAREIIEEVAKGETQIYAARKFLSSVPSHKNETAEYAAKVAQMKKDFPNGI